MDTVERSGNGDTRQPKLQESASGPLTPTREMAPPSDDARRALLAREGRHGFLLELNDRLRQLADPVAVQREASRALGILVGASRVGYAEILDDGETSVVTV